MKESKTLKFVLIIFLIVLGIVFYKGTFFSRAMLAHSVGIMYHVGGRLALVDTDLDASPEVKVEAIKEYIRKNVHSYGNVRDDGASWLLIYGEAWCDSLASIFTRLLEPLDIRAYMIYLMDKQGRSPHTVAYFTLNNKEIVSDVNILQSTAFVADPQFGIIYKESLNYLSPLQICDNNNLPQKVKSHKSFYCKTPRVNYSNNLISEQSVFKKFLHKTLFPKLSLVFYQNYIEVALVLNNNFAPAEYIYYQGRVKQLFYKYDEAIELYKNVLENYPNTHWANLSQYWLEESTKLKNL